MVVEDDAEIAALLELNLADIFPDVTVVADGAAAVARAQRDSFDALLLDLSLPGLDGLSVCRALRQAGVYAPILMLTARAAEGDRIVGLEAGADDYLGKPFSILELRARLRAMLRRAERYTGRPEEDEADMVFDTLRIVTAKRLVTLSGAQIDLTPKEFDLLLWLAQHPGRVYTREQLLDAVWGYAHAGYGHTVNSHINRLRAKIERDPVRPEFVQTVWSVGYRFRDGEA